METKKRTASQVFVAHSVDTPTNAKRPRPIPATSIEPRRLTHLDADRLSAMRTFLSDIDKLAVVNWAQHHATTCSKPHANETFRRRYLYRLSMDFFVHRLGYGRDIVLGEDRYATRPLLTHVSHRGVESGGPLTSHWPSRGARGDTGRRVSIHVSLARDLLPPPGHEYVYVGKNNHIALDFDFVNYTVVAFRSDMSTCHVDLQPYVDNNARSEATPTPYLYQQIPRLFSRGQGSWVIHSDGATTASSQTYSDVVVSSPDHTPDGEREGAGDAVRADRDISPYALADLVARAARARFGGDSGRMHNFVSLTGAMRFIDKFVDELDARGNPQFNNTCTDDVRSVAELDVLRGSETLISDAFLERAVGTMPHLKTRRERVARLLRARVSDFESVALHEEGAPCRMAFYMLVVREYAGMQGIPKLGNNHRVMLCRRHNTHTYWPSWNASSYASCLLGRPYVSEHFSHTNHIVNVTIKNNERDPSEPQASKDERNSVVLDIVRSPNHKSPATKRERIMNRTNLMMKSNTMDIACPENSKGCSRSCRASFPKTFTRTHPKYSGPFVSVMQIYERYKTLIGELDSIINPIKCE